jgi:hypothetical protein
MRDLDTKGGKRSNGDIQIFNNCRLYLQVELVSDIMTADGKAIRRNIWQGIRDQGHKDFSKIFYSQPQPGQTAWTVWKRMLRTLYQCNDSGVFAEKRSQICRSSLWTWYLHHDSERLYKRLDKEGTKWEERSVVIQRRRTR